MSLVRNFTKRARAHTSGRDTSAQSDLPRSCTVRYTPGTINRAKISLPTELISTTNVEAMNAPDIKKPGSETPSLASSADSINSSSSDHDFSSIDKGFVGTDNSSAAGLSPITPLTPFDFQVSGSGSDTKDFFSVKSLGPITITGSGSGASTPASEPVPALPTRALSHSKKAHVEMSRQRSLSGEKNRFFYSAGESKRNVTPPPSDLASARPKISMSNSEKMITRDTVAIFSSPSHAHLRPEPPMPMSTSSSSHPFGRELAKVDEVAEGFGAGVVIFDEEEQEMVAKGLQKFSVDDYLAELCGHTGGIYEDRLSLNPWM